MSTRMRLIYSIKSFNWVTDWLDWETLHGWGGGDHYLLKHKINRWTKTKMNYQITPAAKVALPLGTEAILCPLYFLPDSRHKFASVSNMTKWPASVEGSLQAFSCHPGCNTEECNKTKLWTVSANTRNYTNNYCKDLSILLFLFLKKNGIFQKSTRVNYSQLY